MIVRDATRADIPGILPIWNAVIRDTLITFTEAVKTADGLAGDMEAKARAGHGFFVADDHAGIAGFATYGQFRSGPGYARTLEHSIALLPRAAGQGIGRALMITLMEHARIGGAHSLFAGISSANPVGIAFHAALGFEEVTTLREVGFKWGRWLDLTLMQKFL